MFIGERTGAIALKHFDTILCASGFAAAGFALAHPNTLIIEETEFADAFRCAPLRGFACPDYKPQTGKGAELLSLMERNGLLRDGLVCVNALESILCEYLKGKDVSMLLKAHVLNAAEAVKTGRLSVYTNSGVLSFCADTVLFAPEPEARTLSVLFACEKPDPAVFSEVFPGSFAEPAFYPDRRVVYVDVPKDVEWNDFRADVLERCRKLDDAAKVLYMAPVPGARCGNLPHPVAQFERGLSASADAFAFDPKEV